jgi:hypothetical protein
VNFDLERALPVLSRTPVALRALLAGLPETWTHTNEGPNTWSPYDVVGHLIHGERTDWIPRTLHLLEHGESVPFPVFDREAMFEASQGLRLDDLLDQFAELRLGNVDRLVALDLNAEVLQRRGRHPEFGSVTLEQHLATWVAHDLSHIGQVVRVMAKQYGPAAGPWRAYLPILGRE